MATNKHALFVSKNFAGDQVLRVLCRHMFHAQCWIDMCNQPRSSTADVPDCPNCRGAGRVVASWNFVDIRQQHDTQGQPNLLDTSIPGAVLARTGADVTSLTPRSVTTETGYNTGMDDEHVFPILPNTWADAESWQQSSSTDIGSQSHPPHNHTTTTVYHTDTRLPDGRPSLLIDPGSRGNLSGSAWMMVGGELALKAGLRPRQTRRKAPLTIRGVGHGNQQCHYDCCQPLALRRLDGSYVSGNYTAPTVDHSELPALLGNQTLRNMRAIIDFGRMQLHTLGPGEATISLPNGSESFQLEESPSGHMVLPCGYYNELSRQPRTLDARTTELALHTSSTGASSSGSQEPVRVTEEPLSEPERARERSPPPSRI